MEASNISSSITGAELLLHHFAGWLEEFTTPEKLAPVNANANRGGVLAINGHGTAIPVHEEDICTSYGSLSNRILGFTAVVTDPDGATPDRYAIREFNRGEGDDRAFLVRLGRAFLLDVTLEVIDNYNMRCQSFVDISPGVLFQAPTPDSSTGHKSLMSFLQTGRAEGLWYPLSDRAWLVTGPEK